ncbi:hypothetical protein Bca52824_001242 [Brassica carinata]|uniref:Uncharacterized protein n=1 Tax=Brassica carinata TaxID=52824 RepID=A0A8X7WIQ0_BRACI|nr:hypothetical protein Bca52824_001242 [Brassica carinata]
MNNFAWSKEISQKKEINVQNYMIQEDTRASERVNEFEPEKHIEPENQLEPERNIKGFPQPLCDHSNHIPCQRKLGISVILSSCLFIFCF